MSSPTKLIEAGVDFIRLTSDQPQVIEKMATAALLIMLQEGKEGLSEKPGGMLGFYGRRTRHCFFGKRGEWAMLQITGYVCREQWNVYSKIEAHCTRLDIQHTVWSYIGPDKLIDRAEGASIAKSPANGRHWDVSKITKNGQTQTLYIGSRSSEWYGRIYDKEAESGKEHYKNCVRYEVEIKGDASRDVWDRLQRGDIGMGRMLAIVEQWMQKHGVATEWDTLDKSEYKPTPHTPPEAESKLAWLKKQVAPTVERLWQEGYMFLAQLAIFENVFSKSLREALTFQSFLVYNELY